MSTNQSPRIGERIRRKTDGHIGHIDFIAGGAKRPRRAEHWTMDAGDVSIQLVNAPTNAIALSTKITVKGEGVWEEWERVEDDVVVTVCAACRQAACWYALFFCSESDNADVVKVSRSQLLLERREHWSYLSDEGIERHTGMPPERAEPAELLAMMIRECMIKLGLDARAPGPKTPGDDGNFFTVGPVDGLDGLLIEIDSTAECQSLTLDQGRKLLDVLRAIPDGRLSEMIHYQVREFLRGSR
jgi:hypothetical protein